MFNVSFSCRVELSQNLPDNTSIKSLNELTADFKRMLEKWVLPSGMDITISDASIKASVPFD